MQEAASLPELQELLDGFVAPSTLAFLQSNAHRDERAVEPSPPQAAVKLASAAAGSSRAHPAARSRTRRGAGGWTETAVM